MPIAAALRGAKRITPPSMHNMMDNAKSWLGSKQSVADELAHMSGDENFTYSLLPGTHSGYHDSAVAYQTSARAQGMLELDPFHTALDRATGMTGLGRFWNTADKYRQRMAYELEVAEYMHSAYRAELDGAPVPELPVNPVTQNLIKVLQDSGFAQNSLDRMKRSGMESADGIQATANYLPVIHSPHNIFRYIGDDVGRRATVAKAYGEQLMQQFPGLGRIVGREGEADDVVAKRVGNSFLASMRERIRGTTGNIEGTTKEFLEEMLITSGADGATTNNVLRSMSPTMDRAGESKHLRRRVAWDMSQAYHAPDGSTFRILDGTNTNLEQVLNQYNNTTSARVGLAKKGYTNTGQLTEAFNNVLNKFEGDELAYNKAKDFLDNTKNMLLGRGVGDPESALQQGLMTMARALHLSNSGVFNLLDFTKTARDHGYKAIFKNFGRGWKNVLAKENITHGDAQNILDIVNARAVNEGKLRTMTTHLDSGYQAAHQTMMNNMHVLGQSVQFLNGAEYARRIHIGIITGIQADYLNGLMRGSEGANKYFREIGMSEARIAQLREALNEHGLVDSLWARDGLADEVATRLLSSVDTMALMARKGEAPAFLAYSNAGRVLFPYFTFVAASHNKVLRSEYNRNGATGVALLMLQTAPLAYIAAGMSNLVNNRDIDDDIHQRALSIIPSLGYFSLPVNFGQRGEFGGTPAVFAPINAVPKFLDAAAEGDIDRMVQNSPLLNVALPVRMAVSASSENR